MAGAAGAPDGIRLQQAAAAAAAHFREHASDMVEVKTGGIQFQTTGVRTNLASFVAGEVVIALENAFSDTLSERTLIVSDVGLDADRLAGLDGAESDEDSLRPQNFDPRPGVYTMTGSYWVYPSTIQLRLRLRDARGRSVSWRGHVLTRDLPPGLEISPPGYFGTLPENHQGAIDFRLASGHGRDPAVYEVGEGLDLLMRTNIDAWVYCFYLQSDGNMLKIFPNYLYENPFLDGGSVHTVPGRHFPFNLDVEAPAGIDLVKCFAVSRDVTAELPAALRNNDFEPLPSRMIFRLPTIFRAIPNAAMTEASLVITVNDRAPN